MYGHKYYEIYLCSHNDTCMYVIMAGCLVLDNLEAMNLKETGHGSVGGIGRERRNVIKLLFQKII